MRNGNGWGGVTLAWLSCKRRAPAPFSLGFLTVFFLLTVFAAPSFAITLIVSDFDDTIVETRQFRGGTFETTFKLFRIDHRSNTLQREPDGPRTIDVTPQEYHRIKEYLGRGSRDHGAVGMKVTLRSGEVIAPGDYMVIDPDTFERFNEAEGGGNYLLEDFKAAEKRDPKGNWRGEFWDKMAFALSRPELVHSFGILTARGHSKQDWIEFFAYLKKKGYIANAPTNLDLIHSVSRPEYERFNIKGDVSGLKTAVVRDLLARLLRVPVTERDERLAPDGKGRAQVHYVVITDDNERTLEMLGRLFQETAQGKHLPVKLALFNMGTETQVKESGRPRYAIVESGGAWRRATAREILGEPEGVTEAEAKAYLAESSARSCGALLTGSGKRGD